MIYLPDTNALSAYLAGRSPPLTVKRQVASCFGKRISASNGIRISSGSEASAAMISANFSPGVTTVCRWTEVSATMADGRRARHEIWSVFLARFIATSYCLHRTAPFSRPMNAPRLKSSSALFLQVLVVLVGSVTLGLLLWEPHLEGRNAHATTFETYFKDPFLAYVYVGSLPFFMALYQAFRLFGHVKRTGSFSEVNLGSLRVITRCALTMLGFVVGAVIGIVLFGDGDDRPAGVFMGLLAALVAGAIAITAALGAKSLLGSLRQGAGRSV